MQSMETAKLILVLVASCLLPHRARSMPNGPPSAACRLMEPIHGNNVPQGGRPAVVVDGIAEGATYSPMDTIEFTLTSVDNIPFRGFMIQARATEFGDPIGTFTEISDGKQQVMECGDEQTANTLSHRNRNDTMSVEVSWSAGEIDSSVSAFTFYCSIVQNFTTFWVRVPSPPITVNRPVAPGDINYQLVKAHGSIMIIAWALFAPVGLLLALFYKVVWPNGEWFYTHIAIMIATLVLTLVGIIVIVIHAQGLWLNSTDANLPHQILGIIVVLAVAVNPFMAICRCDPRSPYRAIFNWSHGLTGLILGQGLALAAMMLGLNAFKDLPGVYRDRVHYAIYALSILTGIFVAILFSYNLYSIMFRKYFPDGEEPDTLDTASDVPDPGAIPDKPFQFQRDEDDDDFIEPSRDFKLRAGLGVAIIVALIVLALVCIILIALA